MAISSSLQQFGGAAGGDDLTPCFSSRARELDHAGFVGNGDECPLDFHTKICVAAL